MRLGRKVVASAHRSRATPSGALNPGGADLLGGLSLDQLPAAGADHGSSRRARRFVSHFRW